MYSGTLLTKHSGRFIGAHQKIDRIARNHVTGFLKDNTAFPSTKTILNFEGKNGPDGIKVKSPAQDEPWHYLNPFDSSDTKIHEIIRSHHKNLTQALKKQDATAAAFEAAWLAHAIVDGLTPAHHYPYEEALIRLRGGQGIESRTTIKEKIVMPGDTISEQIFNNWKMWGTKGLMTTHGSFEHGVAAILLTMKHKRRALTGTDIAEIKTHGTVELFKKTARTIAELDMYADYYKNGWTTKLARQTRKTLAPEIIKMVTLAWYDAAQKAKLTT